MYVWDELKKFKVDTCNFVRKIITEQTMKAVYAQVQSEYLTSYERNPS
jgi:hypothetical protein